ncbi:MAG TPA: hypothetical protein VGQ83_06835 [Polyangia bacterium]|jgi:hypothetical protein
MRRFSPAILLCACVACSQSQVQTPARNLDRPTDLALVCMAVDDGGVTPVPVAPARCSHEPDGGFPNATLYGFIANTARGELALIHINPDGTYGLIDLDKTHPAYGFVPLGKLPGRLSGTSDGCRVASANAGTCDLSLVATALAVSPAAATAYVNDAGLSVPVSLVTTVVPRTAVGPLGARPREIAFVPGAAPHGACDPGQLDRAVVTFPDCGLVALVELPGGRILDSLKLTSAGLVPAGASPACAVQCAGGVPSDAGVVPPDDAGAPVDDGGVGDGGAPAGDGGSPAPGGDGGLPTGPVHVGGLAVSPDGTRLYVGAADVPVVAAAAVTGDTLAPLAGAVTLDAAKAGIKRLRLSPEFPLESETIVGDGGATRYDLGDTFLYAFVGDLSVHVVLAKQARSDGLTREPLVECETNPDPRMWVSPQGQGSDISLAERACVRLDATPRPRRAPLIDTPGIVPSSGVPKDVAFWTVQQYQIAQRTTTTASPANTVGTFGFLAISRGVTDILNIQPDRASGEAGAINPGNPYVLRPDPSLVLSHQLRNGNDITTAVTASNSAGVAAGPPRVTAVTRLADGVAYTRRDVFRLDDAHLASGDLAQTLDQVSSTSKSLWSVYFPDTREVRAESWNFTLDGALPGSVRATGNIDPVGFAVEDRALVFCELGAEPGDLVNLGGCVLDSQCGTGEVCVTDPTAAPVVTGLCFASAEAEAKRASCSSFLRTLRQYRVLRSFSERLELTTALEIRHVPGGCDPALGAAETERCNAPSPTDLPGPDASVQHYLCEAVAWRAGGGECVRECGAGRLCGDGYECGGATGRCIAGRTLDDAAKSSCFAELTPYSIQAGDAFLAFGNNAGTSVTGYLHRLAPSPTPDANGRFACVDRTTLTTDPVELARLPLLQGRLPLLPPVCTNVPPHDWPPSPNPCRVDGVAEQYFFDEGGGTPISDGRAVKAYFANPVINVEFLIGRLDDAGGLVVNPPPSLNYSIQADVGGWFQPLVTSLISFLPETLVVGPDGYIYVVDSGLDVSTSGLRGQLLRIDPVNSSIDATFTIR